MIPEKDIIYIKFTQAGRNAGFFKIKNRAAIFKTSCFFQNSVPFYFSLENQGIYHVIINLARRAEKIQKQDLRKLWKEKSV